MAAETRATDRLQKRKAHTKSRKGCFQCKQRHTKCNEAHPRCANCIRLDLHCTWPSRAGGYSSSLHPESHVSMLVEHRPFTSPDLSLSPTEADLPLADLRLLHHWTMKTAKSMHPNRVSKHKMWQSDFIELGFDHPFLLRGFLALAAIHKVISDPAANRQDLLLQADSHISKALGSYRKLLVHPTAETAVPMFLMASIFFTYNLASAQLESPEDPLESVHHCFRLLQGVSVVLKPHWELIRHSSIFAHMTEPAMSLDLEPKVDDDQFEEIVKLRELLGHLDDTSREDCLSAINHLNKTSMRMRTCRQEYDEHRILFTWPATLSNNFLHLLSVRNPIAALIIGYFAALLAQARPVWWTNAWPERIVNASEQVLAGTEFLKLLEWPLGVINARK